MNIYREALLNIKKFPRDYWVVIFSTLVNQLGNMAFFFLVVYVTEYLNLSLMQGSAAFAMFGASTLFASIFVGNIIDRVGAGLIMIGAIMMNGLVLLVIPFTYNFYALIFMCLLWGMFWGTFRPASQTFVSFLSVEGMHKLTFSIYRLAINLGMSVGPALGGFLAAHSYRAIFFLNAAANILAGIILILGLFYSPWLRYRPSSELKKIFSLKWLKQDAVLRLFLIGMVPVTMVFFQCESTLAVYLKQDLNFSLSFYGLLFTINTLLIVFCELLLNIAILHWTYRTNFILGSLFICAGFAGFYFASSKLEIILLSVTWTVGEMILFPSASSYIADIAPEGRRGSYMSLSSMFTNLGLLLGPWAGAVVMQQLGGSALWIACGLVGILSMAIFSFLQEPRK